MRSRMSWGWWLIIGTLVGVAVFALVECARGHNERVNCQRRGGDVFEYACAPEQRWCTMGKTGAACTELRDCAWRCIEPGQSP